MRQPFDDVREQLLRAGIPPRRASRYVNELRDHLWDLEEQGLATGLDERTAKQQALIRLGSEAQLARAMIDRGSPRSLAARAPWSVLAALPVAMLLLATWAINFSMFRLLWPLRDLSLAEIPPAYLAFIATVSFISSYLIGPLLAAGCIVAALRQRLQSGWIWVGLAMIAVFSAPFGFHMHAMQTMDGGTTGPLFSGLRMVYHDGRPDAVATLGMAALRAALLFAASALAYQVLRKRLMPDPA